MPAIRAFRKQPTGGRQSPETPGWRTTACDISLGLDALTACHMGVMSWLDAPPKPPTSTAAHRRQLRATNPFKTLRLACFFSQAQKNGNAALKGLVAPDRQYSPLGREILPGLTVCGAGPPNKPLSWATAFRTLGRRNLFGSPRPA